MVTFTKAEYFFNCFEQSALNILEGSKMLLQLVTDYNNVAETAKKIKDIEHQTDKITHETMNTLNRTFITPIDREDIHAMISELDDIMDFIDAAASRLSLYEVKNTNPDLIKLATILEKTTEIVVSVVKDFKDFKKPKEIMKKLIDINTKENEGDEALRSAMVTLFKDEKNAAEIIKLKEIYENIETAIDRCEDVANVIEEVILKNA